MRLQARGPIGLGPIGWWSPDPRGIIPLDGLHVSRSLRRSRAALRGARRHRVRAGDARVCRPASTARLDRQEVRRRVHRAAPTRVGAQRRDVAGRTTRARRCSSVVCTASRIGGLFAAESKFHRVTDASKVAVVALVDLHARRRRHVARRAVDHAAPGVARRGRRVTWARTSSSSPTRWRDRRMSTFPDPRSPTSGSLRGMTDRQIVVVYHNPVCSKSRGALEILGERGVDVEVIEYLKANPTRADLERIVDAIPDPPAALVRKDKRFRSSVSTPATTRPRSRSSRCCSSTPSSWSARSCSGATAR